MLGDALFVFCQTVVVSCPAFGVSCLSASGSRLNAPGEAPVALRNARPNVVTPPYPTDIAMQVIEKSVAHNSRGSFAIHDSSLRTLRILPFDMRSRIKYVQNVIGRIKSRRLLSGS